jgi:hypothetical protein
MCTFIFASGSVDSHINDLECTACSSVGSLSSKVAVLVPENSSLCAEVGA